MGLPSGSVVKNLPVNAGDTGLIPGSGISPGEGHGNPLPYSCLENKELDMTEMTQHACTKSINSKNYFILGAIFV